MNGRKRRVNGRKKSVNITENGRKRTVNVSVNESRLKDMLLFGRLTDAMR